MPVKIQYLSCSRPLCYCNLPPTDIYLLTSLILFAFNSFTKFRRFHLLLYSFRGVINNIPVKLHIQPLYYFPHWCVDHPCFYKIILIKTVLPKNIKFYIFKYLLPLSSLLIQIIPIISLLLPRLSRFISVHCLTFPALYQVI